MNRSRSILRMSAVLLALPLLVAGLAGCSSGPDVLAKVGGQTITKDDFVDFARNARSQYPGAPDSAKSALLEDLVKGQMMVLAAEKLHLVDPKERESSLREVEQQLALRSLLDKLAPADVPVSDAELRALYAKRANEAHTQIVFTPDSASCARALAEIQGGADFGEVADRFNLVGMTPPHGDLGYRAPGSLIPALDNVVGDGPVGQVTGPVEAAGNGWFLVKILDRRSRTEQPFDQEKEALTQMIRQAKRRTLLERAQKDLAAQYHVKLAPDAVEVLFRRYNAPKDTMMVGKAPMPVAGPPTPEEAKHPLAQYDGANGKPLAYTLGDAVKDLQNESNPHPNFNIQPMVEQWVQAMVMQKVLTLETERRHLAEEPSIVRRARRQSDNVLLQAAYNALVAEPTTVSEQEIRADFERHAAQLTRVQAVQLRTLFLRDTAAAMRAAQAAQSGAGFDDIVRVAGPGARAGETTVSFPTNDPVWKMLEGSFPRLPVGQTAGPLQTPRGFLVLQVVHKTEVPMTYETLDPSVRGALQNEALELKRDRRLNQVADSLRKVYKPVIYQKRLASIPWPVPAAANEAN